MRHDRWGVHMVDIRIGSRINLFGQKIQISVCSKEFGLKNCSKNFWVKNIFDFKKKWVNKWKAGMKWPIPLRRNEIVDSIPPEWNSRFHSVWNERVHSIPAGKGGSYEKTSWLLTISCPWHIWSHSATEWETSRWQDGWLDCTNWVDQFSLLSNQNLT